MGGRLAITARAHDDVKHKLGHRRSCFAPGRYYSVIIFLSGNRFTAPLVSDGTHPCRQILTVVIARGVVLVLSFCSCCCLYIIKTTTTITTTTTLWIRLQILRVLCHRLQNLKVPITAFDLLHCNIATRSRSEKLFPRQRREPPVSPGESTGMNKELP